MNEDNFRFLSENVLPKLGFGDALSDALKLELQRNQPSFSLTAKAKDGMTYDPFFERNDSDSRYYLNSVRATYAPENGTAITQNFALFKQRGFDVEEMSNLLQGRSVYKTYVDANQVTQGGWRRLDLQEKNDQGNFVERRISDQYSDFRLAKELSAIPLAPMNQGDKENLLRQLQKGFKVPVSITISGARERAHLEAAPHRNQVTVINSKGQEMPFKKKENKFEVSTPGSKPTIPETTQGMYSKKCVKPH